MVEQGPFKPVVVGSIPTRRTRKSLDFGRDFFFFKISMKKRSEEISTDISALYYLDMSRVPSKKLAWHERWLLFSFFCYGLASPIFLLFSNTFIWKHNSDPTALIHHNAGIYLGLIIGFIANRTLLLKIPAKTLYQIACMLQAIAPLILVSFAPTSLPSIVGLGTCLGISTGLYFANRNYFTSLVTQNNHRFAFLSLDQIALVASAILSPLTAGWYLTYAQEIQGLSSITAYIHIVLVGFLFMLCAAFTIRVPTHASPISSTRLFVSNASKRWNAVRLMDFIGGLVHGVFITIPMLAALTLLSAEVSIGKLQSSAALIGAFSVYLIGKYRTKIPHGTLLGLWVLGSLIAGLLIAHAFTAWSVVIGALVVGVVSPLYRTTVGHLMYEAVDQETKHDRATLLLDREVFLDIGRIIALISCAELVRIAPTETIRYGFLIATALHIAYWASAMRVQKLLSFSR